MDAQKNARKAAIVAVWANDFGVNEAEAREMRTGAFGFWEDADGALYICPRSAATYTQAAAMTARPEQINSIMAQVERAIKAKLIPARDARWDDGAYSSRK